VFLCFLFLGIFHFYDVLQRFFDGSFFIPWVFLVICYKLLVDDFVQVLTFL